MLDLSSDTHSTPRPLPIPISFNWKRKSSYCIKSNLLLQEFNSFIHFALLNKQKMGLIQPQLTIQRF